MAVNQYDPLAILANFGEVQFIQLAEGTFLEAQRDEDSFTKKVGATGDVVRVKNRNRSGTVKVTFLQTSPTNAQLSSYHKKGESIPLTTTDVQPLFVKDLLGNVLIHATNAWIKKVTNVTYGKDLQGREWTFDCEVLDFDYAGDELI